MIELADKRVVTHSCVRMSLQGSRVSQAAGSFYQAQTVAAQHLFEQAPPVEQRPRGALGAMACQALFAGGQACGVRDGHVAVARLVSRIAGKEHVDALVLVVFK